jgi:N-acetylglucosaminyldiphosphoundecaprenol N-acetyl-beta-D-mannosaminyltransferase
VNRKLKLNNSITLDNPADHEQALSLIFDFWKNNSSAIVNYIYWASYPLIGSNEKYTDALKRSDILLPDGIGMYLYVKAILSISLNNLNGTDFNPVLIDYLFTNNIPVCFYGATNDSINKAVEKLKSQNKIISYFQNGYSELDWTKINDNSALLVGLGTPKQEEWVYDNIDMIKQKKLLVITVGGYFDFLSGIAKRAPLFFRSLKLEWLYRVPQCKRERNLRNLYLINYIIKDRNKLRKLNKTMKPEGL